MPVSLDELALIRQTFPHPVRSRDDPQDAPAYCVGGAFCMYVGVKFPGDAFPPRDLLESCLSQARPGLDACVYRVAAELVLQFNDAGDFERAWHCIELVLAGEFA